MTEKSTHFLYLTEAQLENHSSPIESTLPSVHLTTFKPNSKSDTNGYFKILDQNFCGFCCGGNRVVKIGLAIGFDVKPSPGLICKLGSKSTFDQ